MLPVTATFHHPLGDHARPPALMSGSLLAAVILGIVCMALLSISALGIAPTAPSAPLAIAGDDQLPDEPVAGQPHQVDAQPHQVEEQLPDEPEQVTIGPPPRRECPPGRTCPRLPQRQPCPPGVFCGRR